MKCVSFETKALRPSGKAVSDVRWWARQTQSWQARMHWCLFWFPLLQDMSQMVSVSLVYSVSIVPNLLCLLVPFPHPPLSLSSLPFIMYALTQMSLKGHCFNALPLKYPAASLKVLCMCLLPRSSQSADLAPACLFCRMQRVSSQHQSGLLPNLASEYRVPTCHQWGVSLLGIKKIAFTELSIWICTWPQNTLF